MQKVLIVQEHLPHYRQRFFELLHANLAKRGIALQLAYSPKTAATLLAGSLPWATPVPVRRWGKFAWQNVRSMGAGADLVVVQQESKYIANYLLGLDSLLSRKKLAYWGHGKNFQDEHASIIGEHLKQFFSKFCDWWFAYNDLSMDIVGAQGFPRERITSVQNSIDMENIRRVSNSIPPAKLEDLRHDLCIRGDNIAIFTGGLYAEKRLPFLMQSCKHVRSIIPDFELIIIGRGPEEALIRQESEKNPWIHFVGPKDDVEKVPYWMLSKVLLMPGLVGLVVLDSFVLGVPMITTNYPYHSPEISYLSDGKNGIIVKPWTDPVIYADSIIGLLKSPDRIHSLRENALAASNRYSSQIMADNFASGIGKALKENKLSRLRMLKQIFC